MTYSKEVKREFCWSIKTQRLISAAMISEAEEKAPYAAEVLKAARADKKAEALHLINEARKHTAAKIEKDLEAGRITKRQRTAGLKALDQIEGEAKAAAEAIKE